MSYENNLFKQGDIEDTSFANPEIIEDHVGSASEINTDKSKDIIDLIDQQSPNPVSPIKDDKRSAFDM